MYAVELHYPVRQKRGHEAVVKLLLAENVDSNSKCTKGGTPLSRAIRKRHKAIIDLLLANEKTDSF